MKKIIGIFLVALVLCLLTSITEAQQNKAEQLYQQALFDMEGRGDYAKAIESFTLVMTKFPNEKATAAKALLNIGRCYEKLGKSEAQKAYERIIREFKDQTLVVAEARARLAVLTQPEDASKPKSSNRQILEGLGGYTQGKPSPDGRYLSYSDSKKNSLAIYDLKTGEHTIFANPDFSRKDMFVNESVWSPDGNQLAYALGGAGNRVHQEEIHLINVDGTGHRRLNTKIDTGKVHIWIEDWSRDGKMILVLLMHWTNPFVVDVAELAMVSVDDGSMRLIKTLDNWNWQLAPKMFFSPDGRYIAYSSPTDKKGKTCDVFVIAVDGSSELNITQHPANDVIVDWEPNGNRLLFASDRTGSHNLWVTNIVNGRPTDFPKLIWNNIGNISPMGLTNDGSLYYSVKGLDPNTAGMFTESNIYFASFDPHTGKIISQPKIATMNNNGFNVSVEWSPDGKKLLYLSYLGNKNESPRKLFLLSLETGLEKEIAPQLGKDTLLGAWNWFPDGKHIAIYVQMPNGEKGIYKLEIETGKIIPLVTSKDTTYFGPHISPDNKRMFFVSKGHIYSYDIQKKVRRLLFQYGKSQSINGAYLSPDGKHLVFALSTVEPEKSTSLMIMPSTGGELQTIFRVETSNFFFGVQILWSPDGKYIYFTKKSEKEARFELFRVPSQGGTLESTGFFSEGNIVHTSIRPDGKEIAFCAGLVQTKSGIWVIENVFGEKEEVWSGKK